MNAGNASCYHKPDAIKIWHSLEYIPSYEWWMPICFKEPKPQWAGWGEFLSNYHFFIPFSLFLYADWPDIIGTEHGIVVWFFTSVFLTFICISTTIPTTTLASRLLCLKQATRSDTLPIRPGIKLTQVDSRTGDPQTDDHQLHLRFSSLGFSAKAVFREIKTTSLAGYTLIQHIKVEQR